MEEIIKQIQILIEEGYEPIEIASNLIEQGLSEEDTYNIFNQLGIDLNTSIPEEYQYPDYMEMAQLGQETRVPIYEYLDYEYNVPKAAYEFLDSLTKFQFAGQYNEELEEPEETDYMNQLASPTEEPFNFNMLQKQPNMLETPIRPENVQTIPPVQMQAIPTPEPQIKSTQRAGITPETISPMSETNLGTASSPFEKSRKKSKYKLGTISNVLVKGASLFNNATNLRKAREVKQKSRILTQADNVFPYYQNPENKQGAYDVNTGELMKYGGNAGDQYNYSLNQYGSNYDNKQTKIKQTLKRVPREEANLETEGGETVLTDLNNDGLYNFYSISGPRHSQGGVPLNLPNESFIFSDTPSLKMTKEEMKEMGIKSKKRLTPAQISKRYDLNKFFGKINDEFADDIQLNTAELMLNKNRMSLSKLAFLQERKKNFEDGIPSTAYPFLLSQNVDPFTIKNKNLPKAQRGNFETLFPDLIVPPYNQQNLGTLNQNELGAYGNITKEQLENWQNTWSKYRGLDDKNLQAPKELIESLGQYQESNPKVEEFQNWYYQNYIPAIVDNAIQRGYINPEDKTKAVNALKEDYKINNDGKFSPQTLNLPTITVTKMLPTGEIRSTIPEEQIEEEPIIEPPGSFSSSYSEPEISDNMLPPFEEYVFPNPEMPLQFEYPQEKDYYPDDYLIQDLINMGAIARRDRQLFLPWMAPVTPIDIDYTLEDPTRAIAAINEQVGTLSDSVKSFSTPQASSARISEIQGAAAKAVADELARVNQRNTRTINQAEQTQAQLDYYTNEQRRSALEKAYDNTQVAQQQYLNERNFDREQLARFLAQAESNRANIYNLNQMQDYFRINPRTGQVYKSGSRKFEPSNIDRQEEILRYYKEGLKLGLTGEALNKFVELYSN